MNIELAKVEEMTGVAGSKWNDRFYFNIDGMSDKLYWKNGKVHYKMTKGLNSGDANQIIEKVIGCNITNRFREAADYVVLD